MPTTHTASSHKVTAQVQGEIKQVLDRIPEAQRPAFKDVTAAFRNTGSVAAAVKQVLSAPVDATNKPEAPVSVTQVASPAPVTAAAPTKPIKVQPSTPSSWEPGYSANGFERYKRRLKENGQPVTCYRVSAASTPDRKALVQSWLDSKRIDQGDVFVMVNHTTEAVHGFTNWADCYAASRANGSPALARSVVSSIGGDTGLVRISSRLGLDVTRRIQAIMADDAKADESEEAPVNA